MGKRSRRRESARDEPNTVKDWNGKEREQRESERRKRVKKSKNI